VTRLDDRLGPVIGIITMLARGELRPEFPEITNDPQLEAIVVGLRMLAEEWVSSREELEGRTRELETLNDGLVRLADMGNLLASCDASYEAYLVLGRAARDMLGELSGAVYVYGRSRSAVALVTSWGEFPVAKTFPPADCWALRRARPHHVRALGAELPCRHVAAEDTRATMCVPLQAQGEVFGVLHLVGATADRVISPLAQRFAVAAAEACALALASIRLREALADQSAHDSLTGLYNRRYAEAALVREIAHSRRDATPLSVLMLDLDHFKRVNDEFGHDAGDTALREAARILVEGLRTSDVVSRVGGEEFVLILPGASIEAALLKADHLRDAMKRLELFHRGRRLPVLTFSAGVALYPASGATPDALLRAADVALYEAKHGGRDRTIAAGVEDTTGNATAHAGCAPEREREDPSLVPPAAIAAGS
jgi:diguanylate cyclase (GGDEF)-like protein